MDARWHQVAEDVMTGMKEWRMQHPKATCREIEAALDERLARRRARMLEDALLASRAAYVAVQTAEVEQLERRLPPAPEGPAVQLMSVDGAYVPLVHKE